MKVTDHIRKSPGKTLFSFEIVPPQKGKRIQELYDNIDPLMEFEPLFIDVTTSREEQVFIKRGDLWEKKIIRMRPGTLGICAAITHKYGVDTVPHVLCGGFSKEETEYLLVDCHYLGIKNVMALRGDAMKGESHFTPIEGGNRYAIDLVRQIRDLNDGKYLHQVVEADTRMDFCIGVAGYPEKHLEAPSFKSDLLRLKEKIDAGAHYIVTQMFFDVSKYIRFVEEARNIGITAPIIPGIKPIAAKNHLQLLPKVFSIDIPDDLIKAVEACKNGEQVRQVGIEWAIQQSRDLIKFGVPALHFYSMGKSENIRKIAKEIL